MFLKNFFIEKFFIFYKEKILLKIFFTKKFNEKKMFTQQKNFTFSTELLKTLFLESMDDINPG